MNHSLLIIGPDIMSRGVGGVTIHVQRLRDYLKLNHIEFVFKDSKSNSLYELFRAITKHRIVHLHISNPILLFILVLYGWFIRRRVIMTFHGNFGRFGWTKNMLAKFAIRLSSLPIVINNQSYEACKPLNAHTHLIPAFIPPQKHELLNAEAESLLDKLREDGKIIVSTNASNIAYDKYGHEIYGIDFLIKYFEGSTSMALVISDPSGNYAKRYKRPEMPQVEEQKCNIFFLDYPHPYFEVLKKTDYFVRNTSTDGDALSVKEALWLGVPTICTDVVDRPKGVRLFKYCDRNSFEKCFVNEVSSSVTDIENGAERIVKIYEDLGLKRMEC